MTENYFEALNSVNVSGHTEKKGKFTYLSWPFAYAELFKRHPKAEIQIREWNGFPAVQGPKGWMVCVTVVVDGVNRSQWHPILDNSNRTIAAPDVFPDGVEKADKPQEGGEATTPPAHTADPRDGVWESLSDEDRIAVEGITATVKEYTEMKDFAGAVEYLSSKGLGVEMKTAVWSGLSSAERSAIKKAQAATKDAA